VSIDSFVRCKFYFYLFFIYDTTTSEVFFISLTEKIKKWHLHRRFEIIYCEIFSFTVLIIYKTRIKTIFPYCFDSFSMKNLDIFFGHNRLGESILIFRYHTYLHTDTPEHRYKVCFDIIIGNYS